MATRLTRVVGGGALDAAQQFLVRVVGRVQLGDAGVAVVPRAYHRARVAARSAAAGRGHRLRRHDERRR